MTTASFVSLLFLVVCIGAAFARVGPNEGLPARRRLANQGQNPVQGGWFHSIRVKNGPWCRLKDFPPIGGEGESDMQCYHAEYNHRLMWRVVKTANASAPLLSGDSVRLRVEGPMAPFCRIANNRVRCGVGLASAAAFTIEKETGTGAINLVTDNVVLSVNANYCALTGSRHSQRLVCNQAQKSRATVFQMPASSWEALTLTNVLSSDLCGAYFFDEIANVSCAVSANPGGVSTNLTLALQTPGQPVAPAGTPIALKTYDGWQRYQVSSFKVSNATKQVYFEANAISGANQWFALYNTTAAGGSGNMIANNTQVALWSTFVSKFCGVSTPGQAVMLCDRDGPVSALPAGYKYVFRVKP